MNQQIYKKSGEKRLSNHNFICYLHTTLSAGFGVGHIQMGIRYLLILRLLELYCEKVLHPI